MSAPEQREARIAEIVRAAAEMVRAEDGGERNRAIDIINGDTPFWRGADEWLPMAMARVVERIPALEAELELLRAQTPGLIQDRMNLKAEVAERDAEIARLAEIAWPRPLDADRMLALHRANTAPAVSSPEPASSASAERAALIADLEAWQFAREADGNAHPYSAEQAGTRLLAQAVAALRGEA